VLLLKIIFDSNLFIKLSWKTNRRRGSSVATINYDNSLNFEDFRTQTNQALKELNNKEGVEGIISDTTTIVLSWRSMD
jgi:hypothetical protein